MDFVWMWTASNFKDFKHLNVGPQPAALISKGKDSLPTIFFEFGPWRRFVLPGLSDV